MYGVSSFFLHEKTANRVNTQNKTKRKIEKYLALFIPLFFANVENFSN